MQPAGDGNRRETVEAGRRTEILEYASPPTNKRLDSQVTLWLVVTAVSLLILTALLRLSWRFGPMDIFPPLAVAGISLGMLRRSQSRRLGWRTRLLSTVAFWSGVGVAGLVTIYAASDWLILSGVPRELPNRVKCASNLRQIGQGLQLYLSDHPGNLPGDIGVLILLTDLSAEAYICPSSSDNRTTRPATQAAVDVVKRAECCSYVYVGAGLASASLSLKYVLAYEKPANHASGGMNVLFGDGTVKWLEKAEAKRVMDEVTAGHNPPR